MKKKKLASPVSSVKNFGNPPLSHSKLFEIIGVREIFCQGGAVNHLPKKFSQVARIFPNRTVETKRGPYDATTEAALAYEGGAIL